MSKSKDVGGRPVQKADFQEGPIAAKNFVETLRTALSVPKKSMQAEGKSEK